LTNLSSLRHWIYCPRTPFRLYLALPYDLPFSLHPFTFIPNDQRDVADPF